MNTSAFDYPNYVIGNEEKIRFLRTIILKYKREVPYLRKTTSSYQRQIVARDKIIEYWKQKYQNWKIKYQIVKKEYEEVKKDNEKLKQEIDKLTKTNARYQISLFDHGNFKSQKSNKDKKTRGGQLGHIDTNRESREDYSAFPRIRGHVKTCGKCHKHLSRVNATKEKTLIYIVINPQTVRLILESERQWCSNCKSEINACHPQSLAFTEYGLNIFMMIMILRFKSHSSLKNITDVLSISHGLSLSKSDVSNILLQAKKYLKGRYEKLIKEVRQGHIMYNDETGWLVGGKSAWMWIMASTKITVYFAAESRGRGIMEELYGSSKAYSMHDGLTSYLKAVPQNKSLYCWAHVLRFSFEETFEAKKYSTEYYFRKRLVDIYRLKDKYPCPKKNELFSLIKKELDKLISQRSKLNSINKIQRRLIEQRDGLIRALVETKDATNNLAERELRPMVINKRISYGSNTFSGMETTAILGSVIQTLSKDEETLLPSLKSYLQTGVREKYPQYLHTGYFDSS